MTVPLRFRETTMLRSLFTGALCAALMAAASPAALAHEDVAKARQIAFPKLPDGRSVLAVDLHTHSVFSDGSVWPTIRVEEAKRDGLYAYAATEHIEYQPKAADIPHADRNRSFKVASEAAAVRPGATGVEARPLMVINGAEITKARIEPGHINAVFLTDANALKGTDATEQLKAANAQGAFTFWNHPYWIAQTPNGIATLTPIHRQLIKDKLLHGIEVVNGSDYSEEAFKIALDNNLTVMGTSDIHGLIDWDYDLAGGQHRTATLVLTKDETQDGLKAALRAGATVAIYNDNLIGKKDHVEAVVRGTLRIDVGDYIPRTTVVPVKITNSSPVDYMLENVGAEGAYDEGHVFTVKANSEFTVVIKNVPDRAKLGLTYKALNTYIGPREHLTVRLTPASVAPAAAAPTTP
jgi:3',5'-nucleoside bisphosphate phosphatase